MTAGFQSRLDEKRGSRHWLTDISTFDEMNAVWDAWVSPGNPPARATVEAALAGPKGTYTVEIMVTAALP